MTISAGTKLGRYEIRSQLGAGGMGEVFLAQDKKLERTVALKVLPADVTADRDRMIRFVQEAKTASALNHPNILTIHEIDETDAVHFIATEYVEGETLRQRMRNTPMKVGEVLDVAVQIASALSAAHAAGIVHRDIKPENVMLRRDGLVKVLDFGLAKVTEPLTHEPVDPEAPTRGIVNTEPGMVMGTAIYMSPEQARGLPLDGRTDTFSLGVVLYEMVAGSLPFHGPTTNDVIAAVLSEKEPPPLARFARQVPSELEHIVSKALRKDREERYQTVKDMLIDLKDLRRDLDLQAQIERTIPPESSERVTNERNGQTLTTGAASPARSTSTAEYLVSEIKSHKRGAVVILAVLLSAAAILSYSYFRPKPAAALTEKDTILLADFNNTTGDAVFDGTLKQALAVQLGQSPFINIFGDERIREALRFMGRSPDEHLTREVALEICQRQGLKGLLTGSISALGSHYVITLEAINAQSGDAMAREQVEAESKEQVLNKFGEASTKLRERLGESLASIQRFDAPLEQATTSKLEALKVYSQGAELHTKGKYREAIPFYKRAVELDPNFALAYARLSSVYSNTRQIELSNEAALKAFDLRDRVSERERLYIEWSRHGVSRDVEKEIEVLEIAARTFPRDYIPHNNLALRYNTTGAFERAIEEAREAIRLNPNAAPPRSILGSALIALNRFDEAKQVIKEALAQKLESPAMHGYLYSIAFIEGDTAAMNEQIDWASGKPEEAFMREAQAEAASFSGQLQKSKRLYAQAVDLALRHDLKEVAAQFMAGEAVREATYGNCSQVSSLATRALQVSSSIFVLNPVVEAFCRCGDALHAEPLIDEISKLYPKATMANSVVLPRCRGQLELSRGNAARAIELLEPPQRFERVGAVQSHYFRGMAYLKLNKSVEAAAEFQKIIEHRGWLPRSVFYPLAHLGLGRAAVLMGDTAKARKAYEDFFAFWKDADADLPILIEAKNEYRKLN